jgi:hypothetical protein
MKANAKRDMLTIKKIEHRLEQIDEKLDRYLQQLLENDYREDLLEEIEDSYSDDGFGNPGSPNQELLDKIVELQKQVEQLQKHKDYLESQARRSFSPTDPDAQLMKSRDGKVPAYNTQIVVDQAYHMIAHSQVFDTPNDANLLEPVLDELSEELEVTPEKTLTDSGYYNLKQMETVETHHKTTCYIPRRKHKDDDRPTTFVYDKEEDQYLCSQGKRLRLKQKNRINKGQHFDSYQGIECDGCPVRAQCTTSKYGRIFNRFHNQIWRETYHRRMAGILAKKIIHLRKQMVEHPFGTIRSWMGKVPLLLRGNKGVSTEINIYSTVYNLRRLLSIETYDNILEKIQDYDWKLA